MSTQTPAERVAELLPIQCVDILVRIVEIVDAHRGGGGYLTNDSMRAAAVAVADALHDWSLID